MVPALNVGDIAIIKKCDVNDIQVNDIIEYAMDDYTVVHRVIEIKQQDGQFYFVTKGDNNPKPDSELVTEDQLIGKCLFKIKYLGYPAIWINNLRQQEVIVET